jgi:hypothetical protein
MTVARRPQSPAVEPPPAPAPASDPKRGDWLPSASVGWRAVELVVLCTFAFAQPVFTDLEARFFLEKDLTGIHVLLVVLITLLAPPGVLLAVEQLARRVSQRAAQWVHLVFVGLLLTAIASGFVLRMVESQSVVQAGLALLAGGAVTFAYARFEPARSFVRVLAPAPVIFVSLLVLTPPVSAVLFPNLDPPLQVTGVRNPVVMVVFDEFPVTALMNSREQIDAERFPNFARLARDATWFRNATTAHSYTKFSVPAIASGDRSKDEATTTPADHPTSIFTVFGRTHDFTVSALPGTSYLCPTDLCPQNPSSLPQRYWGALRDMAYTSFPLVLPDAVALKLPKVSAAWRIPPKPQIESFVRSIRAGKRPTLAFLHTLLPHDPYLFLPSGKRYPASIDGNPAQRARHRWTDAAWLVTQQQQRELLQVAFVDRLLGQLVDRLKRLGIYDEAAIAIVADHGVNFEAAEEGRFATPENLEQIMPVPFFLKAPRQTEGAVRDDPVQTIDVLPTLVGSAGARIPWRTDGVNVLAQPVRRPRLTVINDTGESLSIATRELLVRRRAALRTRIRRFGEGSMRRIFAAGPHRELLGKPAPADPTGPAEVRIEDGGKELASYDPSSEIVPARVVGHLVSDPKHGPVPLAIAINGQIRATTWTYPARDRTAFSAMLPPAALRPGRNDLRVLAIERGGRLRALAE